MYMNTDNTPHLLCPHCWEEVHPLASKCPHCLSDLSTSFGDPVTRVISIAFIVLLAWVIIDM
jgi:predicted amidophosphoribosyltransferase